MIRPMLKACSPCGMPTPQITSSTRAGSTSGLRSRSLSITKAPVSSGRSWVRDPLKARPIGVRRVSTITASGIECSLSGREGFLDQWIDLGACRMLRTREPSRTFQGSRLTILGPTAMTEATDIQLELSPEEAAAKVADGAQLIDVRQDYEWEAGRIDGAEPHPARTAARAGRADRPRPADRLPVPQRQPLGTRDAGLPRGRIRGLQPGRRPAGMGRSGPGDRPRRRRSSPAPARTRAERSRRGGTTPRGSTTGSAPAPAAPAPAGRGATPGCAGRSRAIARPAGARTAAAARPAAARTAAADSGSAASGPGDRPDGPRAAAGDGAAADDRRPAADRARGPAGVGGAARSQARPAHLCDPCRLAAGPRLLDRRGRSSPSTPATTPRATTTSPGSSSRSPRIQGGRSDRGRRHREPPIQAPSRTSSRRCRARSTTSPRPRMRPTSASR